MSCFNSCGNSCRSGCGNSCGNSCGNNWGNNCGNNCGNNWGNECGNTCGREGNGCGRERDRERGRGGRGSHGYDRGSHGCDRPFPWPIPGPFPPRPPFPPIPGPTPLPPFPPRPPFPPSPFPPTNCSVTIGTITTLPAGSSATVTNVGTPCNAILNFGIPVGGTVTPTPTPCASTTAQLATVLPSIVTGYTGATLTATVTLANGSTVSGITAFNGYNTGTGLLTVTTATGTQTIQGTQIRLITVSSTTTPSIQYNTGVVPTADEQAFLTSLFADTAYTIVPFNGTTFTGNYVNGAPGFYEFNTEPGEAGGASVTNYIAYCNIDSFGVA